MTVVLERQSNSLPVAYGSFKVEHEIVLPIRRKTH